MADQRLYRVSEIAKAFGIRPQIVTYLRKKCGIESNKKGYTYEECKAMARYRQKKHTGSYTREGMVRQLKMQLRNDGYQIAEDMRK